MWTGGSLVAASQSTRGCPLVPTRLVWGSGTRRARRRPCELAIRLHRTDARRASLRRLDGARAPPARENGRSIPEHGDGTPIGFAVQVATGSALLLLALQGR